jgi:hypothetical protein
MEGRKEGRKSKRKKSGKGKRRCVNWDKDIVKDNKV